MLADDGVHVEEVILYWYMHGFAKGHYVSNVLCTVGSAKYLASTTLGSNHHTSHGELGNGGNHRVFTTEAKV